MILIGLENSKRNILIDDSFNDGQQTDDTVIMLEAWGVKEVGCTNADILEGVDRLIYRYLSDFTTLNDFKSKAADKEIGRFIKELHPKLVAWSDTDHKETLINHDFVVDATGVKRHICMVFQKLKVFNR